MSREDFYRQIKEKLLEARDAIISDNSKNDFVDSSGDESDKIQANMLVEMSNSLEERVVLKLKQINLALSKIESKTYGDCNECGEEIMEKRLLFNPHFLDCVFCAETKEKERKQRIGN